ncbi:preprotein translocase subunit SecE [Mycobacterium sp. AZCC_0083]|uniref:preprotein translocase subunit SecE n=1 Tax=Mycobacterium sp. AZCC_0083 TaxID=2735882 RepID=UPI00160EA3DA|nr:preprotein translocase subunit SecE [Mycobacterium sp. AZCC_0083]MBB5164233.1 preprotein translocase subunit SecE [Mycobacterium sp. AZCC_0083]
MSDERDSAGAAGDVTDSTDTDETGGQTAVGTRPLRPTGKRSRRGTFESDVTDSDADVATEAEPNTKTKTTSKNGSGKKKTAKKSAPRQNPFVFVWNFLKQVVAELRKVIWPNRKQMVSYTTVVLVFLVFMVALIGGVDLGFAKLVGLVFG